MNVGQLLNALEDFDQFINGVNNIGKTISPKIASRHVSKISHDHRNVDADTFFVALTGNTVDSHAFIPEVREENAAFIIGQKDASNEAQTDLNVGSTRAVLGPLSSAFHGYPSEKMTLVGITGTNGKTTVSYLYSSIVLAAGRHCFTMGTTGILLDGEKESDSQTTPDPLLTQQYFADFLADGIKDGALEVSSHALEQFRVLGTHFSAVAFSNFSQDHLDYHGTMQEYFDSKMRLFSKTYSPTAVINVDDPKGLEVVEIAKKNGQKVITVSNRNPDADVYVQLLKMDLNGSELKAFISSDESSKKEIAFSTPLIGDFNHENIAVALGLSVANGIDLGISIAGLSRPQVVPGRLQRVPNKKGIAVFVDYAHTPDALERVLKTTKPLAEKTIIVFGCGGDRDQAKRSMMGRIASQLADTVVITNDNPRSEDPVAIAEEISKGAEKPVLTELDRRKAIKLAISQAQDGDVVIIAGKGHELGQIFSDHTEPFSDMEVANEIIAQESNEI